MYGTRNVNRNPISFPYYGKFYDKDIDMSLPLDEREVTDVLVFETECDIQEVSKAANPVLIATFSIFFPFDLKSEMKVRRGMKFVSDVNGMMIEGMVTNVVVSQLGGAVAYVKDYTADE